jgi:16S rRNA (cytidine1402-2'-O)-methyltransferase
VEALKESALIACEDTRHTVRLLQHYGLHVPLISLTEHNEAARIPDFIRRLRAGETISLVSDAGFPTVSDPGQRLVHAVIAADLRVEVIPGPSAVLTALAASGLPTVPFYFGGFLPHKKGQRSKELEAALQRECTSIYYESPYRLVDTLGMLAKLAPEHPTVVARELTKMFEEYRRGPARSLLDYFSAKTPKGEITLLLAPRELPKWMTRGASEGTDSPAAHH